MAPIVLDPEKEEVLLERLGGQAALKGVVYEFYGRMLEDPALSPFFAHTEMDKLRDHQYRFLEIAFTGIPGDMDVKRLIAVKHARLFEKGLNESHFDLVAGHLVGTLTHLGVAQKEIDDVVAIVGPLRSVFKDNAGLTESEVKKELLLDRLGGGAALKGVVYEFYGRLLEDPFLSPFFAGTDMDKLRDHQYRFMEIAFTSIPKDMDVVAMISEKHQTLFAKGLNATHFDILATHLVATLEHLNVKQELINEVVAVVGPLRVAFEK